MTLPNYSFFAQLAADFEQERFRRGIDALAAAVGTPFENWTEADYEKAMVLAVSAYTLPVISPSGIEVSQVQRKRGRPLGGLFTLGRRIGQDDANKRTSSRSSRRRELLTLFTTAFGIEPVDAVRAHVLMDFVHHPEWSTAWDNFLVQFASRYPSDVKAIEELLDGYARATSKSNTSTKARYRAVLRNHINGAREFLNCRRK